MEAGVIIGVVMFAAVIVWLSVERDRAYRALIGQHQREQDAWVQERRELLSRIQRPDILPPVSQQPYETPEPTPDDWALVGTIHNDPEAYLRSQEPDGKE